MNLLVVRNKSSADDAVKKLTIKRHMLTVRRALVAVSEEEKGEYDRGGENTTGQCWLSDMFSSAYEIALWRLQYGTW